MDDRNVRKDYDPMRPNTSAAVVVVILLLGLACLLAFGILETAVHL